MTRYMVRDTMMWQVKCGLIRNYSYLQFIDPLPCRSRRFQDSNVHVDVIKYSYRILAGEVYKRVSKQISQIFILSLLSMVLWNTSC